MDTRPANAHTSHGLLLSTLADTTRRTIYETLARGPLVVSDIAKAVPVSRPAVSQHLKALKAAGLVDEERSGRHVMYRALSEPLSRLSTYLDQLGAVHRGGTTPPPDDVDRAMVAWAKVSLKHDPGTVAMITRLFLLSARMERLYAQTTLPHGLNVGESMILGTLRRAASQEGMTPSEIARVSLISRPDITKRLARLENAGMIRRQADALDHRSHRVLLTAAGETVTDAIANEQFGHKYLPFFRLPTEQHLAMDLVLRHLVHALGPLDTV
jgi:DNA-binding transcriptional ArsR family regulator